MVETRERPVDRRAGGEDALTRRSRARVGTTLCGKYRLERLIGIGGMAAVYAGTHRNGRRVAIKMLHREYSLRGDIRARFLREGQAANAVRHPAIVAVLDDDITDDGAAFVVMELLEGKSIEQLWEEQGPRLHPKLVLGIAHQLCGALHAAHEAGVVHRDIKPANLFLTTEGLLKVLDFGLAQLRDVARPKLTLTGVVFGTPAFMAPEQAAGRTSQVDRRTDIWAVGATMFTLLSGRTVHEGETAQAIAMSAATQPSRSLAAVLPSGDPAIVDLVDRALAADRAARWRDAREMADAIRQANRTLFGAEQIDLAAPGELTDVAGPPIPSQAAANGSTTEPDVDPAVARRQRELGPGIGDSGDLPTQRRESVAIPMAAPGAAAARRQRNEVNRPELIAATVSRGARWSSSQRAPERFGAAIAIGIAVAAAIVTAGALLGLGHHSPGSEEVAPIAPEPAAATTAASSSPPPEVASAPPPPQRDVDELSAAPAETATASATSARTGPPSEAQAGAEPTARATMPKTPPSAASAFSGDSRNCTPPYRLDDAGYKRWKRECL